MTETGSVAFFAASLKGARANTLTHLSFGMLDGTPSPRNFFLNQQLPTEPISIAASGLRASPRGYDRSAQPAAGGSFQPGSYQNSSGISSGIEDSPPPGMWYMPADTGTGRQGGNRRSLETPGANTTPRNNYYRRSLENRLTPGRTVVETTSAAVTATAFPSMPRPASNQHIADHLDIRAAPVPVPSVPLGSSGAPPPTLTYSGSRKGSVQAHHSGDTPSSPRNSPLLQRRNVRASLEQPSPRGQSNDGGASAQGQGGSSAALNTSGRGILSTVTFVTDQESSRRRSLGNAVVPIMPGMSAAQPGGGGGAPSSAAQALAEALGYARPGGGAGSSHHSRQASRAAGSGQAEGSGSGSGTPRKSMEPPRKSASEPGLRVPSKFKGRQLEEDGGAGDGLKSPEPGPAAGGRRGFFLMACLKNLFRRRQVRPGDMSTTAVPLGPAGGVNDGPSTHKKQLGRDLSSLKRSKTYT